jgi:hypothetical protein
MQEVMRKVEQKRREVEEAISLPVSVLEIRYTVPQTGKEIAIGLPNGFEPQPAKEK